MRDAVQHEGFKKCAQRSARVSEPFPKQTQAGNKRGFKTIAQIVFTIGHDSRINCYNQYFDSGACDTVNECVNGNLMAWHIQLKPGAGSNIHDFLDANQRGATEYHRNPGVFGCASLCKITAIGRQ